MSYCWSWDRLREKVSHLQQAFRAHPDDLLLYSVCFCQYLLRARAARILLLFVVGKAAT